MMLLTLSVLNSVIVVGNLSKTCDRYECLLMANVWPSVVAVG